MNRTQPKYRAMTKLAKKMSVSEVVQTLRNLEDCWPPDYWLFAHNGTLRLMSKRGGPPHVTSTGEYNEHDVVTAFQGIECDGLMKTLRCLVLCKNELFYQAAGGVTLKTEYPVSSRKARDRARKLGVDCHFE